MFATKTSVRETGRKSPDEGGHTYVELSSGAGGGASGSRVPAVRQHGWDHHAKWWYEDIGERCEEMQKKFPLCPPVFNMPFARAPEWKRMLPGPEPWTMPSKEPEAMKEERKEKERDPERYHEGIQLKRCETISGDNVLRTNHDCVRSMGCQLMVMFFLAGCIDEEYQLYTHWRDRWRFFIITWILMNIFLFAVGWMKAVQRIGDVLFIWLAQTNDHVTDSGMGIVLEVRQLILSRVCGLLMCEDEHFTRLVKHNGWGKICPGGFPPTLADPEKAAGDPNANKDRLNVSFEGRDRESQMVIDNPECYIDAQLRFVCDDFDGVIRIKWCCDLETMSLETNLQDNDSNYYNLSESYYHQYYYGQSDADKEAFKEAKEAEAKKAKETAENDKTKRAAKTLTETKTRGVKKGDKPEKPAKPKKVRGPKPAKPLKPKGFDSSSPEWRLFRPWLERDMDWVIDVSSIEVDELVKKIPWWYKLEFQLQLDQSRLGGFRDYLGSALFNDRVRFKLVAFFTPMIACLLVYLFYFVANDIRHPHVFRDTFQMFHHTGVFIGIGCMMNLVVSPWAQSAEVAMYVVNTCMWLLEKQVRKDWMVVFSQKCGSGAGESGHFDAYVKAFHELSRDPNGERTEQLPGDKESQQKYVEWWFDHRKEQDVIDMVDSIPKLWQIVSSTDNMKDIWKTVYEDICTNQPRQNKRKAMATEVYSDLESVHKDLKVGATNLWNSAATSLQTKLSMT